MNDLTPFTPWKLLVFLVTPLLALMLAQTAFAAPGETGGSAALSAQATANGNSLTELKRVVGRVVLSEDACGTNMPSPMSSCTVDIVKPSAAATVRQADLFCATTPFEYVPENDDVTLNGVAVAWNQVLAYDYPGGFTGHNTQADVTAIVKPLGDAALPGVVMFTITENPTLEYDGCALKVIWDDPTTTVNSILIFWGHQEVAGDTFVINFAPLTPAAFATPLEFSLGISFGFQPGNQLSNVDVNTLPLTRSAGGQDDGGNNNGELITLGGTGDTVANPGLGPPVTPSIPDDELYDLRPFTSVGATSMTIFTINPSNDDNIFLANLFLRDVRVEVPCPPEDDDDNGDDGNGRGDDDDDDDNDGLTNKNESLFLTLLGNSDSDFDGIKDGDDDANGNGEDDEDEDDDECPDDDDSDGDGVDDEDEDDEDDDEDDD